MKNIKLPSKLLLLIGLAISILLIFTSKSFATIYTKAIITQDSIQYWVAGNLFSRGGNPYDLSSVLRIQTELGKQLGHIQNIPMMLYPPWVLPILAPFGLISYSISYFAWLLINLVIILITFEIAWRIYRGPKEKKRLALLVVITFFPTFFVLVMGHITPVILLGIVGTLYFIEKSPSNTMTNMVAGAFAALTTLKPQLTYLFLITIFVWSIYQRRWFVLLGTALTIAVLSLIAMFIIPQIFYQYLIAISDYPLGSWPTPTFGAILRRIMGWDLFWIQFIPSILGLGWLTYYLKNHLRDWSWSYKTPIILLVSIVTSSYAWTYDMVILVIPLIFILVRLIKFGYSRSSLIILIIYIIVNIVVWTLHMNFFLLLFKLDDSFFFWYGFVLLILYITGFSITQNYKNKHNNVSKLDNYPQ